VAHARVMLVAPTAAYQTDDFQAAARRLEVDLALGTDRCHVLAEVWPEGALALDFRDPEQAAAAIAADAARAAGIVHRDLKPHNLFHHEPPGDAPLWKVLDFGVSKLEAHGGTLTRDHVVGTPMYMAPEQAQGKEVDHRADVYSLAAVAYRALTGRPPFSGKDTPAILYQVVHSAPVAPELLLKLPADVARVLALGLAKAPVDRVATAMDLATALAAAARSELSDELRGRADALLAVQPWSTSAAP